MKDEIETWAHPPEAAESRIEKLNVRLWAVRERLGLELAVSRSFDSTRVSGLPGSAPTMFEAEADFVKQRG
jgi:hypothetical protein